MGESHPLGEGSYVRRRPALRSPTCVPPTTSCPWLAIREKDKGEECPCPCVRVYVWCVMYYLCVPPCIDHCRWPLGRKSSYQHTRKENFKDRIIGLKFSRLWSFLLFNTNLTCLKTKIVSRSTTLDPGQQLVLSHNSVKFVKR